MPERRHSNMNLLCVNFMVDFPNFPPNSVSEHHISGSPSGHTSDTSVNLAEQIILHGPSEVFSNPVQGLKLNH